MGVLEKGKAMAEEGLALVRRYECPAEMILALGGLIIACYFLNEWTIVEQACQKGLHLARAQDDQPSVATSLVKLSRTVACLNCPRKSGMARKPVH